MKNAPQHDFDYAQRVATRFAQFHGQAALAAQAPIRLTTGWWSPLFPYTFLHTPKTQQANP